MWATYLKTGENIERDWLLENRHPTPAEYSTFLLFVETHPNPANPMDATEMAAEDLASLIPAHVGPNAVHISISQATEMYNILIPDLGVLT